MTGPLDASRIAQHDQAREDRIAGLAEAARILHGLADELDTQTARARRGLAAFRRQVAQRGTTNSDAVTAAYYRGYADGLADRRSTP